MSTNAEDFRASFAQARDGGRPMSTNAEELPEFRSSFAQARARDGGRPMSTNAPTLTREQWRTVLDDTDRPTFG